MLDRKLAFRSAIIASVFALVAAGCGTAAETTSDAPQTRLSIVAVTSILGSIVEDLVGDTADVTVLMGSGVDPHNYQVSARDGQLLRTADLVVANGPLDDGPLEENLLDLLMAVRSEGVSVFDFVAHIDAIALTRPVDDDEHDAKNDDHGDDDHDDDEHDAKDDDHGDDDHGDDDHDDHAHGSIDPHFWWDLSRVADGIGHLASAIAAIDTERPAVFWSDRGAATAKIYQDLDQEILGMVSVLSEAQRVMVTNHDALGYFADRYGFTVLATVIPGSSTTVETNPREFATLIDRIVDEDVTVVFAENTDSTRLVEQLSSQVASQRLEDLRVVRIYTDALGPAGSGAETFKEMMRMNVGLIVDALG